ncbi:MAG: lipid II:glycine glycyltransferase FemX [bacterium]|jgi:peptidoglycan pentaglycine glycine transferase (the first glycine)
MDVRLIRAAEKDYYNSYIETAPKGHFLQTYEWGELKAKTGWEPLRLVAEEKGIIKGAISILKRRLPLPGKSIFYAPRGPVIDVGDWDVFNALLAQVRRMARSHGAIFLKVDPDIPVTEQAVTDYFNKTGFVCGAKGENFEAVQPKFVFRLDIARDLDAVFADFASKTRYNIRLAERKGVIVVSGADKEMLPAFYGILQETAARDRFLIRSYSYFDDIWELFVRAGKARLFMAEYEGKIIAGTLAFLLGDKAWYLYGASSNRHRNVMPNYLLQWEMIRWAKENGCAMYDFRGVSGDLSPDNPLYGLYRFKKGFSGDFIEFIGEFDYPFSPTLYWVWNRGEPLYRSTRRQLAALLNRGRRAGEDKDGEGGEGDGQN